MNEHGRVRALNRRSISQQTLVNERNASRRRCGFLPNHHHDSDGAAQNSTSGRRPSRLVSGKRVDHAQNAECKEHVLSEFDVT